MFTSNAYLIIQRIQEVYCSALLYSHTISNNSRTSCSDSPRYLDARVEEETLKNVVPHSVATALANNVFPVPGGPTINTPFHGLLMPWKYPGIHNGRTTASSSSLLASFKPAMLSLHDNNVQCNVKDDFVVLQSGSTLCTCTLENSSDLKCQQCKYVLL